jgi:hypothetical protein
MKLFQFLISSNSQTINLKQSFFVDTLELKSIYFMNSVDLVAGEEVAEIEISFLEAPNIHTSQNVDLIIMPLNLEAGKRKSKKQFEVMWRNLQVPQNFSVKVFKKDGSLFDNAKIGEILINLEANSK